MNNLAYFELYDMDLQLFDGAGNTNVTTDSGLSDEMKVFYSDYLIDNAKPKLVHDQFGQKHPIPKNGGKVIEFRKYSPLPKMTTPIKEGVTPDGQKLNVTTLTAKVDQYGSYVELSDILMLTAIDNNLVQATKLLGNQAGATLDTITREVLNGGTNVQYASGQVAARHLLVGGDADDAKNHYLTVDAVKRAARFLKVQNAEQISGAFVAIVHPDISFDLTNDPAWINVKTYSDPEDIYEGEIGKLHGVRFVETTEAKIFRGADLTAGARNLTVKTAGSTVTVAVNEAITAEDQLVGRKVLVGNQQYEIKSVTIGDAGAASITLDTAPTVSASDVIYPGEGGSKGRAVYSTLVLADNAYGITEIEGGGLQHIVKQLGSAGTADPLNQRATAGWKAIKVAERLVEPFMLRIETCGTFDSDAN